MCDVRFPVPGPISSTIFSICVVFVIFSKTFLSIKNFDLNFFCLYQCLSKKDIALIKLKGLDLFLPSI